MCVIFYFSAELGLMDVDYYHYLNYGEGHKVDDVNDVHDFEATLKGKNLSSRICECCKDYRN